MTHCQWKKPCSLNALLVQNNSTTQNQAIKKPEIIIKSVFTCIYCSLILYHFSMGFFWCLTKEEPSRFLLFSTQECWKLKLSRFVFLQWTFTKWCKTEYSSPETHIWMNTAVAGSHETSSAAAGSRYKMRN